MVPKVTRDPRDLMARTLLTDRMVNKVTRVIRAIPVLLVTRETKVLQELTEPLVTMGYPVLTEFLDLMEPRDQLVLLEKKGPRDLSVKMVWMETLEQTVWKDFRVFLVMMELRAQMVM